MKMTVPSDALCKFLYSLEDVGWAVIKNPDLWGSLARGGDWDLVVGDRTSAERLLSACLGPPLRILRRSYVTAAFYEWGEIDLLPGVAWRGVELVASKTVIEQATRTSSNIAVARLTHQAIAAWIYPILAYRHFDYDRYGSLVAEALRNESREINCVLRGLFGVALANTLRSEAERGSSDYQSELISLLRRTLYRRALWRDPVATAVRTMHFVATETALRLPKARNAG